MSKYYRVALSPKFNTYVGKKDLEVALTNASLSELMPTGDGNRIAFYRTMDNITKKQGIKFKVVKESPRDIMWEIRTKTHRILGVYTLSYGTRQRSRNNLERTPTWTGSRSRTLSKGKTQEDKQLFSDIAQELNDCLNNPGINAYTVHLRAVDMMKEAAVLTESRPTATTSVMSKYYIMDETYLPKLEALVSIYDMFDMKVSIELIKEEQND